MTSSSEEKDFFLGLQLRKEFGIQCLNTQGMGEQNDPWPRYQWYTAHRELSPPAALHKPKPRASPEMHKALWDTRR